MVREIQVLFSPALSICLQFFLGFGSVRAFPGRLKNLQRSSLHSLTLKDFSFRDSSPVCVHDLLAVTSLGLCDGEGHDPCLVWRGCRIISNRVLLSLHLVLLQAGLQQEWWCERGKGICSEKSNICVESLRKHHLLFLGGWELIFWAAGKGKCHSLAAAGSACDSILDKEWINYNHHMQWTLNFFQIIILSFLCW